MPLFSWVPFHRELARRLLDYESDQMALLALQRKQVDFALWRAQRQDQPQKGVTGPAEGIDPFSFFASFTAGQREPNRLAYLAWLREELGMSSEAPRDIEGLPTVHAQNAWFFPHAYERGGTDIPNLWRLARQAASGAQLTAEVFESCLAIKQIGPGKLTQGLFWMDPNRFMPVDGQTSALLATTPAAKAVTEFQRLQTLDAYLALLGKVHESVDHDFLHVSHKAWVQGNGDRWSRPRATAVHAARSYWMGGHEWSGVSQAPRFQKNRIWEMGFDETDTAPPAKRAWLEFRRVRPGDYLAIKGFGGSYHLKIYDVGEVVRVIPESRRIELRPLAVDFYDGDGFRGAGAGNQMGTLGRVSRPDMINTLFFTGHRGEGTNLAEDALIEREEVVRHLIGAMVTRPLVLLAGVSGSGKTQLAATLGRAWAALRPEETSAPTVGPAVDRLFASLKSRLGLKVVDGWVHIPMDDPEQEDELDPEIGAVASSSFAMVPVRADWQEAASLWGWIRHDRDEFLGTRALDVVLDAWERYQRHESVNHVLVLDEMNLARLEHYGSDLLSAMERQGEPLIELHARGGVVKWAGTPEREVPARIGWAPGLRLIGTVNVDETTFAFAPKVLDRAAVLEFLDIDLAHLFAVKGWGPQWDRLGPFLECVQTATRPHALHLGYRAAIEVVAMVTAHLGPEVEAWDEARLLPLLDLQLRNKILPRVRGPRGSVEEVLLELLAVALSGAHPDRVRTSAAALRSWRDRGYPATEASPAAPVYPGAAWKARAMLERARLVGFTSFF